MPEIVSCPQCERKLRVPDELLGKKVKCPTCGTTFTAEGMAAAPLESSSIRPDSPPTPRAEGAPDDRSPVESEFRAEPDYDDAPRHRPMHRTDLAPHRGVLILVFGILSLVVCALFGPFAWVMGNNDLAEMRAGRMDREGEGLTNAGRICGMIASILFIVVIVLYCGIFACVGIGGGLGGGFR